MLSTCNQPKTRTVRLTADRSAMVIREQKGSVLQVDAYFLSSIENGYKLTKADCTGYTVSLDGTPACDCKGFTYRRTCRHVDSILKLIDLGKL